MKENKKQLQKRSAGSILGDVSEICCYQKEERNYE